MTVLRRRRAGPNHAVVQVCERGPHRHQRVPCATCPWRVDAVGIFPAEAFRISAHTAYDAAFETFACHSSGQRKPSTCAGFLLRNAVNNIAIRLRANSIDWGSISDGGHELHASYRAMAIANGVDPDDPVLAPCRGDDE